MDHAADHAPNEDTTEHVRRRCGSLRYMSNTLPALTLKAKSCAQYILFAADETETWRYPRLSLRRERRELAVDAVTVLEVMHVRANMMRDQANKICSHLEEIMWWAWCITYRIWRILYHALMMVDEVGAEVVEMLIRVPRVLLELLERARER